MEAVHKVMLLVTAMICATVLAAAWILASSDGPPVSAVDTGTSTNYFCPPRLEARDAC